VWSPLSLMAPPLCAACGGVAARAEPLCAGCRRSLRWLGPAATEIAGVPIWAPVAYEGPARGLVRALKFAGATRAASVMAAQIAAGAPPALLDADALVPVPLHPRRRRRRGYNQADLLARAVGERTGLTVLDCLTRTGRAGTQVGRDRGARLTGPPGAIGAAAEPPPRTVLVDDVVTTGGTLAACAAALRAAGSGRVRAVAYARTPGR
jgi:ComF family protein